MQLSHSGLTWRKIVEVANGLQILVQENIVEKARKPNESEMFLERSRTVIIWKCPGLKGHVLRI